MKLLAALLASLCLASTAFAGDDCATRCADSLNDCMRDCAKSGSSTCAQKCGDRNGHCMKPCMSKMTIKDDGKLCVDANGKPAKCPKSPSGSSAAAGYEQMDKKK